MGHPRPAYGIVIGQAAIKSPAFIAYFTGRLSESACLSLQLRSPSGPKTDLIVVVNLSSSEQDAVHKAGHTHAQASSRLLECILEVLSDDRLKSFLPSDFHGETGRSLVKACKSVHFVEDYFPIHDSEAISKIWHRSRWRLLSAPVQDLREYFGEEIAFYFAWVEFYLMYLWLPGVLGFVLWGLSSHRYDVDIDHNAFAPFYGIAVALWSSFFVAMWRRRSSELSYQWDCFELDTKERVRPEFAGNLRKSPVTGLEEQHSPYYRRLCFYLLSAIVTAICLLFSLLIMFALLNMQGYVDSPNSPVMFPPLAALARPGAIFDPSGSLALAPVILYSMTIMLVNKVYRRIAEKLTDLENHRLERNHLDSLIFKRVLFESFDCYAVLMYIAFYQFNVTRLRSEVCFARAYTCECAPSPFPASPASICPCLHPPDLMHCAFINPGAPGACVVHVRRSAPGHLGEPSPLPLSTVGPLQTHFAEERWSDRCSAVEPFQQSRDPGGAAQEG